MNTELVGLSNVELKYFWKRLSILLVSFLLIFLLTLGFELMSNFVLCLFLFFSIDKITFHSRTFIIWCLLAGFTIPFYIIYQNDILLKYLSFILRMIFFLSVAVYQFQNNLRLIKLKSVIDLIFSLHIFFIILSYLSPSANSLMNSLFAYSLRDTNMRVSGLFSGFDIVSYFVMIYLAYDYLIFEKRINFLFLIKLIVGAFAILQSGRFGVIPLIVFLIIIFGKIKNIKWLFLSVPIILFIFYSGIIESRVSNVSNTVNMVIAAFDDLEMIDDSFFDGDKVDGQYNQSPITWFYEVIKPFMNIKTHILPGVQEYVDSGPSFLVLNFGLLIGFFLYLTYFKIINLFSKEAIPLLIVFIFLLSDLKFRLLYSLMPLVWLFFNHLAYLQKRENIEIN